VRAKEIVFSGAKRTGILRSTSSSEWRRRRLLILCYHGVSMRDEHEWNAELYIPPNLLRQRLEYLRASGYNILRLAEGCERLQNGTLPPRSVALTFDDGAADFAAVALPILRELDAPATVYITTYYSDIGLPVFDVVLSYVLWRGRERRVDLAPLCDRSEPLWAQTPPERQHAHATLVEYARARELDVGAKDALVARVAGVVGVNYGEVLASGVLRIMTPDTVAALPRELVDVQLHTHRHRTPLDRDLFLRELRDNASSIRALRGHEARLTHFCYPSGVCNTSFLPWLREAGVRYATTCAPGLASPNDHPLLLPRWVDTTHRSSLAFEAWVSGFADLLPKRPARRLDEQRRPSV